MIISLIKSLSFLSAEQCFCYQFCGIKIDRKWGQVQPKTGLINHRLISDAKPYVCCCSRNIIRQIVSHHHHARNLLQIFQ